MSSEFEHPLLSIIVPNYNNAKWLSDCLDSIMAQTYRNIEIIVADDCSTDDSADIIHSYAEKHPRIIKYLFQRKNVGVAKNRHYGIIMAKGEYITTIDSDDYYYDKNKLKEEMELVMHHKKMYNENICAFSNTILVSENKNEITVRGTKDKLMQGKLLHQFMQRSCEIPINFILLKDLYFKSGGYAQNIPIYEDWDLKIRISSMVEFYYTGLIGTAYRRHNIGLSSAEPKKHIKWLKYVFYKNECLVNVQARDNVRMGFQEHIQKLQKKHFQHKVNSINESYKKKQHIRFLKNWIDLICIDTSYIRPKNLSSVLKKAI